MEKSKILDSKVLLVLGLIAFAIVTRLMPHLFNVTSVSAVALFSGYRFRSMTAAILVPLVAMFCSDLVLGLHNLIPFVYAPIIIAVLLGRWMSGRSRGSDWPVKLSISMSVVSSTIFFVVSNFGVWITAGEAYPKNLFGLEACYVAAIPFFQRTLMGDLMFTVGLFAAYAFAVRLMQPEVADHRG